MYATPKVKFVFDRRKRASKTTNGAIEIEVCFAGQRVRMSTGICVRLGEWADGKVVKRLDAQILNRELNDKYNDVYDTVKQMIEEENVCLDKLKDYRFGERRMAQKLNALDWIEERIELRPVRESTRKQHKVMLRALRASKLFYSFKDFTPANVKLWDDMLHKQLTCQSSVHGYHKRLKPYIAEAIQLGLLEKSPYEGFHISRGRSNNRKYISAEERAAVEALELTGGEAKARDLFIFACYTGLAYADLVKITESDIQQEGEDFFLHDTRQKTGGEYRLILLPQALAILRKYNFNLNIITNQKTNYYLKIVGAKAKIKTPLSVHVGRHTFATWALSSGINIEVVSKMLAHADIKTTQIYAKVLQQDVTSGFSRLKAQC